MGIRTRDLRSAQLGWVKCDDDPAWGFETRAARQAGGKQPS